MEPDNDNTLWPWFWKLIEWWIQEMENMNILDCYIFAVVFAHIKEKDGFGQWNNVKASFVKEDWVFNWINLAWITYQLEGAQGIVWIIDTHYVAKILLLSLYFHF